MFRVNIVSKVIHPVDPASVGTKEENLKDISGICFENKFMILTLADGRTRLVRNLEEILCYEIVEQPVTNPHKVKGKK